MPQILHQPYHFIKSTIHRFVIHLLIGKQGALKYINPIQKSDFEAQLISSAQRANVQKLLW